MTTIAKLRELYEAGLSLREIESITGVPNTTARGRLIAAGVKMRKRGGNRKFPPHDEYAKTVFLYTQMKWSVYEIAEALDITHSTVQNRLRVHGVQMRTASESYRHRYERRGRARNKVAA